MNQLDYYKDTIAKLKPELKKNYGVGSIGLFGSVVRRDFSIKNSDIDIIVDFETPIGIEFIALADYLEQQLDHKVDLVSKKGIKPQYFNKIEAEIVYV